MELLCINDGLFEIKVGVDGEYVFFNDVLVFVSSDGGGI